jgi:hypothetical protein
MSVICEVTHPATGTVYRTTASPSPPDKHMGVLGAFAPRRVVVQYPTEFDHAPKRLSKGVYRVRWELPPTAGFGLFGTVIHDAFRI